MTLGTGFAGTAAGTGRRLMAFTADVLVIVVVAVAVGLLTRSLPLGLVAAFQVVLALWILEARTGATVGKALLGLRTARDDRPYSPGAGRGFVRGFITALGLSVAVVGAWLVVASSAWDPSGRRRSWADRAAQTVVVAVPTRAQRVAVTTHAASGTRVAGIGAQVPAPATGASAVAASQRSSVELRSMPPGVTYIGQPPIIGAPPVAGRPAQQGHGPAEIAAPAAAAPILGGPQVVNIAGRPAVVERDPVVARTGSPAGAEQRVMVPAANGVSETSGAEPVEGAEGALLLIFDTGQRAQLPLPVVANLGRNPAPTAPGDRLLGVRDPDSTVSKTHLRLEYSRGNVWITDGGSTNGTDVLGDDGSVRPIAAGVRTQLEEGDRVRIGNRTLTMSLLLASDGENL